MLNLLFLYKSHIFHLNLPKIHRFLSNYVKLRRFLCKKVSVLYQFICREGDKYGKILLIT